MQISQTPPKPCQNWVVLQIIFPGKTQHGTWLRFQSWMQGAGSAMELHKGTDQQPHPHLQMGLLRSGCREAAKGCQLVVSASSTRKPQNHCLAAHRAGPAFAVASHSTLDSSVSSVWVLLSPDSWYCVPVASSEIPQHWASFQILSI